MPALRFICTRTNYGSINANCIKTMSMPFLLALGCNVALQRKEALTFPCKSLIPIVFIYIYNVNISPTIDANHDRNYFHFTDITVSKEEYKGIEMK